MINSPYCVCDGSSTLPLLTNLPSDAVATASCAYTTIPASATIQPARTLAVTTSNCRVCTRVVNNENACTMIPGCLTSAAVATVQVGSSPVHVGTLTGTALYTSVSSALEKICPTVSQTIGMTACQTDPVTINDIDYVDGRSLAQGELVVRVDSSQYNATSLRDAMIKSAALTAQNSAQGKNCYDVPYTVENLRRRDLPYPTEMKMKMCNEPTLQASSTLLRIGDLPRNPMRQITSMQFGSSRPDPLVISFATSSESSRRPRTRPT